MDWINVKDFLPNTLPYLNRWPYYPYDDYKFKVKITNGIEYYSYFKDGKWQITERNPKFIVEQWQPPKIIACRTAGQITISLFGFPLRKQKIVCSPVGMVM